MLSCYPAVQARIGRWAGLLACWCISLRLPRFLQWLKQRASCPKGRSQSQWRGPRWILTSFPFHPSFWLGHPSSQVFKEDLRITPRHQHPQDSIHLIRMPTENAAYGASRLSKPPSALKKVGITPSSGARNKVRFSSILRSNSKPKPTSPRGTTMFS